MFSFIAKNTTRNIAAASQRRGLVMTREIEEQLNKKQETPVIVVGGGHAGIEAATASARQGVETTLITPDIYKIGVTSCNPAFGRHRKGDIA